MRYSLSLLRNLMIILVFFALLWADNPIFADPVELTIDGSPIIGNTIDGELYIEIGGLKQVTSARVAWFPASGVIGIFHQDKTAKMTVGSQQANIDGDLKLVDMPPLLVNGQVLIPAQVLTQLFGFSIAISGTTRLSQSLVDVSARPHEGFSKLEIITTIPLKTGDWSMAREPDPERVVITLYDCKLAIAGNSIVAVPPLNRVLFGSDENKNTKIVIGIEEESKALVIPAEGGFGLVVLVGDEEHIALYEKGAKRGERISSGHDNDEERYSDPSWIIHERHLEYDPGDSEEVDDIANEDWLDNPFYPTQEQMNIPHPVLGTSEIVPAVEIPSISGLDEISRDVLTRLASRRATRMARPRVFMPDALVFLDPAHGGGDRGIRANGHTEAELVLDISQRLKAILESMGINIMMTREEDRDISEIDRITLVNLSKATLLLSIHINASFSHRARGIEIYQSAEKAEEFSLQQNAGTLDPVRDDRALRQWKQVRKIEETKKFANIVRDTMASLLPVTVAQPKSERMPLLELATMPAIVTELGYLTNAYEKKLLTNEYYREELAEILAEALLRYLITQYPDSLGDQP